MHKAVRELLLIVTGAVLGDALFLAFVYSYWSLPGVGGTGSEGLPLAWRWFATGFPPPPNYLNFDIDIVFWFVAAMTLVEILGHKVLPHFIKPVVGHAG